MTIYVGDVKRRFGESQVKNDNCRSNRYLIRNGLNSLKVVTTLVLGFLLDAKSNKRILTSLVNIVSM